MSPAWSVPCLTCLLFDLSSTRPAPCSPVRPVLFDLSLVWPTPCLTCLLLDLLPAPLSDLSCLTCPVWPVPCLTYLLLDLLCHLLDLPPVRPITCLTCPLLELSPASPVHISSGFHIIQRIDQHILSLKKSVWVVCKLCLRTNCTNKKNKVKVIQFKEYLHLIWYYSVCVCESGGGGSFCVCVKQD